SEPLPFTSQKSEFSCAATGAVIETSSEIAKAGRNMPQDSGARTLDHQGTCASENESTASTEKSTMLTLMSCERSPSRMRSMVSGGLLYPLDAIGMDGCLCRNEIFLVLLPVCVEADLMRTYPTSSS